MTPQDYMKQALLLAKKAYQLDEVPVGCVIVYRQQIIGQGYNTRQHEQHVVSHAEMNAIQQASRYLNSWRLNECDLYVTLEPCLMCGGAIYQSRIRSVYFGAYDQQAGCYGSIVDLSTQKGLNHYPLVQGGICQEACQKLLLDYFSQKR